MLNKIIKTDQKFNARNPHSAIRNRIALFSLPFLRQIYMGIARNAYCGFQKIENFAQSLPRYRFIRKAVTRFMPGETLEEALSAAEIPSKKTELTQSLHNSVKIFLIN